MMRKYLALILFVVFCVNSFAQLQRGFVRTAGTAERKGHPLSSVTIRLYGGSVVLSDETGQFSMSLSNVRQEGELFQVTSVRKAGYELLDKDALKRKFVYSKSVPIEIVMVSSAELLRTKQKIEERARKNATQAYEKKLKDLKRQLERQTVTIQDYNAKIKELENQMESFESLIGVMAEHYARTDYDKLDSLNAAINHCIEEGELDKADSLINTKGDVVERATRNIKTGNDLRKAAAQIDSIRRKTDANSRELDEEKRRLDIWIRQEEESKKRNKSE